MAEANLLYRKATASDVPVVLNLVQSAYRGDSSRQGWTTEADLVAGERIDKLGLLEKINEPHGAVLLAQDDSGATVACCEIVRRDGSQGYFGLFAVDPQRQAGGVGRKMLAEAERYAKLNLGISKMVMWVIWSREELISWYVRRGYVKTDRTEPFPYDKVNGRGLQDDLHFTVLEKDF